MEPEGPRPSIIISCQSFGWEDLGPHLRNSNEMKHACEEAGGVYRQRGVPKASPLEDRLRGILRDLRPTELEAKRAHADMWRFRRHIMAEKRAALASTSSHTKELKVGGRSISQRYSRTCPF